MANGKELISGDLYHEVEEAGRAQNRELGELVTEAVRKLPRGAELGPVRRAQ